MQQPQPAPPFAPAIGFARNRETAPAYWMLDLLWLVLVDGHETGGAFSVMEQWMRQGSGPPIPHIHPIDEWFYVRHPICFRQLQQDPPLHLFSPGQRQPERTWG